MTTRYSSILRRRRSRGGSAAIEFGFWVVIMMVMVSGIIDFGWFLTVKENVERAARDGARSGAALKQVGVATTTGEQVLSGVGLNCGSTPMTASLGTHTIGPGVDLRTITVSATCPFVPLVGLAPGLASSVNARYVMFLED